MSVTVGKSRLLQCRSSRIAWLRGQIGWCGGAIVSLLALALAAFDGPEKAQRDALSFLQRQVAN
jgi:hypothetical protein